MQRIVRAMLVGEKPELEPDTDAELEDRSSEWKINEPYRDEDARPYRGVQSFVDSLGQPDPPDGAPVEGWQGAWPEKKLVDMLETAGLLGMGGAGGRAYKKWTDVFQA